jgi:hypothetical protein
MARKLETTLSKPRYWIGDVGPTDDYGMPVHDEFIDGVSAMSGKWAIMNPHTWRLHGVGKLGTGYGQRYKKQADGKWLKVEG